MIVSPRPAVPSTLMPLPSRSTSAGPPVVLALHCSQVPSCLRLRRKQDPIVFALMVALHVVQEGTWEQCSARTTGGPAEVLREGSGIRVDGTAGRGLTIMPELPSQKGLIHHRRAQSNEFWLKAATRTSFWRYGKYGEAGMVNSRTSELGRVAV